MTKDEMKNRISMALKDPILQQGFEIICKDLAISEHDKEHNDYELTEVYKKVEQLEKENAELKERLKKHESVGNAAQFWANVWSWKAKAERLAEAKETLAKLLEEEKNNMYWEMNGSDKSSYYKVRKEAERFISEAEK